MKVYKESLDLKRKSREFLESDVAIDLFDERITASGTIKLSEGLFFQGEEVVHSEVQSPDSRDLEIESRPLAFVASMFMILAICH